MNLNSQPSISGTELHRKLTVLDEARYTSETCEHLAETIAEVNRHKRERRAVILAHNYQRPEIFEVADFIGDSFELARKAREVRDAEIIVFCGVHFMAETAKVFNPERMVLLPDMRAGCSLADSITADALAERKEELLQLYPDLKVISYVNCTADVKALSDACCTSANAAKVVNAHPECRKDVLALADAVLSTSAMMRYARESSADKFLVVTECGLSDRLLMEIPDKHFYKACKLCRFMKMITLDGTLDSLRNLRYEITLSDEVREGAKHALEQMLELGA